MWIRRFQAVNAGPHRHLDLRLKRGLVGILGPNGSGKSHVLDLAYACITNDFGRFATTKAGCIHDHAGPDDPSWVEVELEHDGVVLLVRRDLRRGKHALTVDGGRAITSAPKIQETLQDALGLDAALLDLFVFKRQEGIYDFLATTPAPRARAFQVLCRTTHCEAIWELLGRELEHDARDPVLDTSDDLLRTIAAREAELGALGAAWAKVSARVLDPTKLKARQALVRKADRQDYLQADLTRCRAAREEGEANHAKSARVHEGLRAKAAALEAEVKAQAPAADAARAALARWAHHERAAARRAELDAAWVALRSERAAHPDPEVPEDADANLNLARDALARRTRDLAEAQACVDQFDAEGVAACPTCGTPVAQLAATLAAHRKLVREGPEEIRRLKLIKADLERALETRRKYVLWKKGYDARRAAHKQAVVALEDDDPAPTTAADPEACRALVEAQAVLVEALEALGDDRATARARLAAAAAALASAQAEVARLEAALAKLAVDPERVARARRALDRHEHASARAARLKGQADAVEAALRADQSALEAVRARLARTRKVRALGAITARVRTALHRDRLPGRVARANLRRMEGGINRELGHFGDPFWVESAPDLSFVVHKPGFPPEPAARLSVGQRVVLAIPFWFTVGALWGHDVGCLALDEPTAHLDAANRDAMATALEHFRATVRGARQVLMVTHAENLRACFDQVVDLGAGAA